MTLSIDPLTKFDIKFVAQQLYRDEGLFTGSAGS